MAGILPQVFQSAVAAVGNGTALKCEGYATTTVEVTISNTATVTFEGAGQLEKSDGTYFAIPALNLTTGVVATTATASGNYLVFIGGLNWFRVRVSAWTSGTVSAAGNATNVSGLAVSMPRWTSGNPLPVTFTTTSSALAILRGNYNTYGQPYRLLSAATTNAASIKASGGLIRSYQITNTSAALKYIKFYNKASAPTVGTDTPVLTIAIPATTSISADFAIGINFSLGIGLAITGAVADADTTAVAANDVILNVIYD